MLELQNLYIERTGNLVYLKSDCVINGRSQTLWYSTSSDNEKYISTSNGDAFILMIFIYAIFENLPFKSNIPISSRLKFGLLEVLLPAFQRMNFSVSSDQFIFLEEDTHLNPEAHAIGAAMSFGVDSFFAFTNKLDYITIFNAGAFGVKGDEATDVLFDKMKERVGEFALRNNLGFIWVDTNLKEVFNTPFVQTHTFRNFACALVFQKLFKTYYYASGLSVNDFSLNKLDPCNYDLLSAKAIASNSLEFHISGLFENRIEKTKAITKLAITYDNLNVCLITTEYEGLNLENTSKNCSKCFKCVRTMVSLDILGKLDLYNDVFDLNIYTKNKTKYLAELLYKKLRANEIYSKEIFQQIKFNNYRIPFLVYYYTFLRFFRPINTFIKKTLIKYSA